MVLKPYLSDMPQFKKFSKKDYFVSGNYQKYPVNLSCMQVNMISKQTNKQTAVAIFT